MNIKYYAEKFLQLFPEYVNEYQNHIQNYGKILGHVFFGDAINQVLFALLKDNTDKILIKKYIDFIKDMYSNGDSDIKNIVEVTILEYLGDDDIVLKNSFTYFSEDLKQASKDIEAQLGRRNITVREIDKPLTGVEQE